MELEVGHPTTEREGGGVGLPLAAAPGWTESVGTLKIGYPCIQALSQDKEQGVHPRTAT
jgi:hypothetical protein